jgi:hypothetical protein
MQLDGSARKNLSSLSGSAKTAEVLFFENRLLGYEDAAHMLGMAIRTLREKKASGEIKFVPIGKGERGVRFRVKTLLAFIEKREISA